MKKLTLLMLTLLGFAMAYAQNISVIEDIEYDARLTDHSDALTFTIQTEKVHSLLQQKSSYINFVLPFTQSNEIILQLEEIDIYAHGFVLTERNEFGEKIINLPRARHFKGRVQGQDLSSVTLSVFEDHIEGVVRLPYKTYNFGKINMEGTKHILYRSEEVTNIPEFKCETLGEMKGKPGDSGTLLKTVNNCTQATEIYFECDYDMYTTFGTISAVSSYVTSMFTEVATIYTNESVPLVISQIVVWTSADPYSNGSSAISDFSTEMNNTGFSGDLAQLLTNDPGAHGGIAFVDELCGNNPYSYCDIVNTTHPYPTYSWDVQVVTHELGHNFGSVHTHDCAWGPNGDQQIDDCGNIPGGGGSCYDPVNPIIPSNGGTIMSYCHINAVGINFANGFATEPGDLIRDRHSDCKCDNPTCDTAIELPGDGTYSAHPNSGNGASSPNATHADWFYYIPTEDGTLDLSSCGEGEDTRVWIHTGSCGNLTYQVLSDDDCDMGNGLLYASEITGFPVQKDSMYFIEWDDRWSTAEFDFDLLFIPAPPSNDCDDINLYLSGMITDSTYKAEVKIDADGMIMPGYNISLKAGQEIELMPGFETQLGSQLDIAIENCANN